MPTLTPSQRKAYDAFTSLWEDKGFTRKKAFQIFKELLGYDEVPYFMELDVPECERIYHALQPTQLRERLSAAGRKTGICQVCGRELTDPVSVREGIGPVCSGRLDKKKFRLEDLLQ